MGEVIIGTSSRGTPLVYEDGSSGASGVYAYRTANDCVKM